MVQGKHKISKFYCVTNFIYVVVEKAKIHMTCARAGNYWISCEKYQSICPVIKQKTRDNVPDKQAVTLFRMEFVFHLPLTQGKEKAKGPSHIDHLNEAQ